MSKAPATRRTAVPRAARGFVVIGCALAAGPFLVKVGRQLALGLHHAVAVARYERATPPRLVERTGRFREIGRAALAGAWSSDVAVLPRAVGAAAGRAFVFVAPAEDAARHEHPRLLGWDEATGALTARPLELDPRLPHGRVAAGFAVDDVTGDGVGDLAVVWRGPGGEGAEDALVSVHAVGPSGVDPSAFVSLAVGLAAEAVDVVAFDVEGDDASELVMTMRREDAGGIALNAFFVAPRGDGTGSLRPLARPVAVTGSATRLEVVPDLDLDGRRELAVAWLDAGGDTWLIRPAFELAPPYSWELRWHETALLAVDIDRDGTDELVVGHPMASPEGRIGEDVVPGVLRVHRARDGGPRQEADQSLWGERGDAPFGPEVALTIEGVGPVLLTRAVDVDRNQLPTGETTWDAYRLGARPLGTVAVRFEDPFEGAWEPAVSPVHAADLDGDGRDELLFVHRVTGGSRTTFTAVRPTLR